MSFQPHTRRWFKQRIGKEVRKVFLPSTPDHIKYAPKPLTVQIASPIHAESLYLFHKDYKVNFVEV